MSVRATLMGVLTVLVVLALPASASEENPIVSPELQPGQSFRVTFNQTGTLDYHCHPHPWMVAQIVVKESSGRQPKNWTVAALEPEGKDFEEWTWMERKLVVEVGDTVTWVNNGTVMHKVQETTKEHAEHIGGVEEPGHEDAEAHADEGHSQETHSESGGRIPWYAYPMLSAGFIVAGIVWWQGRR